MNVLRLVGLVVIAGIAASVFAVVYPKFLALSTAERAKDAADKIQSSIEWVIISTGNPEDNIKIEIPGGYELTCEENRVTIDGIEREFSLPINGPYLNSGEYELSISIENQIVEIKVVD